MKLKKKIVYGNFCPKCIKTIFIRIWYTYVWTYISVSVWACTCCVWGLFPTLPWVVARGCTVDTVCVWAEGARERERESVCISVMYSCLCLGWSHGESSLFKTASARSVRAVRDTETDAPVLSRPLFTHARAHTHTCSRTQTATFL